MKHLSPTHQTIYSDLVQWAYNSPEKPGSVYVQKNKGEKYLYVKYRVGKGRRDEFIGPANDPDAQRRAADIRNVQNQSKDRRTLVKTLTSAGVPAPTRTLSYLLDAISDAGLFSDAVLVGTAAYICFSPITGVILPSASLMTQDVDLATTSLALGDDTGTKSMLDILKRADPTFRPIPALKKAAPSSSFRADNGFVVDLLTPAKRRSDENPMPLANLQAGAVPLQYLDWLIETPVKAIALYGIGIPVKVPEPARYAAHKLIVAQKRSGSERSKRAKDLLQAKALLQALMETDPYRLQDVVKDAFAQGTRGWKLPMERSLKELEIQLGDLL